MMKPIEIHIEGYKIVISEDDESPKGYKEVIEKVQPVVVPHTSEPDWTKYPSVPPTIQPKDEWWKYPYVTWTNEDGLGNINTTGTNPTPVRDFMVNGGIVCNTQEYKVASKLG